MSFGIGEPDDLGVVVLEDGRRLGWAAWGPADGFPVLFFSGAAMGRSLGFGAASLQPLGVRLLAVERPGLGASDPEPDRTLADWPRDVTQAADRLGLSAYSVIGFSQGAPFALACVVAGLPASVAIVSGQDDLQHPPIAALLDEELAGLVKAIAANPAGVEDALRVRADARMLWGLIVGGSSDLDLGIYTDPAFAPAFQRALNEGFVQGPDGYVRDLVLAMGRWPFDLGAISVPVDLWYGGHDTSAVHSPDHGVTLAGRIPSARRWLLADAGGSLLWTHAEPILTSLLQRAGR